MVFLAQPKKKTMYLIGFKKKFRRNKEKEAFFLSIDRTVCSNTTCDSNDDDDLVWYY